MTLENILSHISVGKSFNLLDGAHKSLTNVDDETFYIESTFKEISGKPKSQFIVFSAPGAAGKTTLARKIAHDYHSLYWDLSKILIGENCFSGTLIKALGSAGFVNFSERHSKGETFIVIDAFDEANMISGKRAVDYLLSDIYDNGRNSKNTIAILFARTETAKELISFFNKVGATCSQYEIGFIPSHNAKCFVKEIVKSNSKKANKKIPNETIINECVERQFAQIGQILEDSGERESFLGYPPVLEALGSAYDEENNTVRLLNSLKAEGTRTGAGIVLKILEELLDREHQKVTDALRERWADRFKDFNEWEKLYSREEQLIRILEYADMNSYDTFYESSLKGDILADYLDVLNSFIKEHPFIRHTMDYGVTFTGPAFRDYVLAQLVCEEKAELLLDDYLQIDKHGINMSSQLLFDLFTLDNKRQLPAKYFTIIYDSYKAKEDINNAAYINVYNAKNETYAEFSRELNNDDEIIQIKVLMNEKLIVRNLINTKIDIPYAVQLGDNSSSITISNTTIDCEELILSCNNLFIKADREDACLITARRPINSISTQFTVECAEGIEHGVWIDVPRAEQYYSLRQYVGELDKKSDSELIRFAMTVEKIMDLMRTHGKDAPARDKEYIDNIIISENEEKRKVLALLMEKGIIYNDSNEAHLYKVDKEKLKAYGIGWQTLTRWGKERFRKLYNEYTR